MAVEEVTENAADIAGGKTDRHPMALRLVHWVTAFIMAWMVLSGIALGIYGFSGIRNLVGGEWTNFIYTYHKTFGVIILGLFVLRLIIKAARPKPAPLTELSKAQHMIAGAVHIGLYVLLFAMPVLGWLGTASGGFPVQFFSINLPGLIGKDKELSELLFTLHWYGGLLITVLIAMHVGAALMHRFVKRDGVFRRISLP
ncbi:MAG: cytochrome b [Alphaproteobacteria bacterium]|nr:cytochrome b [Alphaproteobacteria bacterium SS10]